MNYEPSGLINTAVEKKMKPVGTPVLLADDERFGLDRWLLTLHRHVAYVSQPLCTDDII